MTNKGLIYGIDLGTTFSCIAAVNDATDMPEVKPNCAGDLTTPSVVYFESGNPEPVVGKEAKRWAHVQPDRVFSEVKRKMGLDSFRFTLPDKEFRPEAISAFILRKLVSDALVCDEASADGDVPAVI